jgi:hypothetical protein
VPERGASPFSGFEGSNYIIIDNSSATGFQTVGSGWTSYAPCRGEYGADTLMHAANQPSPDAVIVDNGGAGTASVGSWSSSATAQAGAATCDDDVTWEPSGPLAVQHSCRW